MNTNADMGNEIELTNELRNYACNATQQHLTVSIKVNDHWHLGHACITDKLVQFNFEEGGRHHFFTPDGFEQFLVRIPSHESINRTVFNIINQKKHGSIVSQQLRFFR